MTLSSLRIVDDQNSLKGTGAFLRSASWNDDVKIAQPRALRALARIIDGGLCHRCGSCVGICPTKVLTTDNLSYPRIENLSACTDCDLCVKVCPGDEFDYHKAHRQIFDTPGDELSTHGEFIKAEIAHASDSEIREQSTSGGLVTALLLHLIETRQIDGALVIVSDPDNIWKGKPIIARTRSEILASMKSKYAISPTNSVFDQVREIPGKYCLVGLPCQIHGFVKAAELDQRIRERIVLTVGLFCHAAIEHEAFEIIWDSLGDKRHQAVRYISRIGKHPGTPHIELEDGSFYPVYFPDAKGYRPSSMELINIIYRLYTPPRCLTCFDALAEFADIAVGDPWMAPPEDDVNFLQGWSFALIRSARALKYYDDAVASGSLTSREITRREALKCNTMMSHEKRWRAFRIIETHRRQGKPIPAYHFYAPKHRPKHFLKTEIHMLTHIFCFVPSLRSFVLRTMLSPFGYGLLWVNHKRRLVRDFLRDTKAKLARTFWGRR